MNKAEQEEIDELANDLAYQRLKFSALWNHPEIKSNGDIDAKASAMAIKLKAHLEQLVKEAEESLLPV